MILALSAGPLLILSFYHFQSTYEAVKVQAFQSDLELSSAFSRELRSILESRVEVVKSLAASSTYLLHELDQEQLITRPIEPWNERDQHTLKTLQKVVDGVRNRSNYFDFMYVARLMGESLAISPLYSPKGESYLGANYRDRDYFQQLLKSRSVAISQVQLGKRSKRPNIQIVAPIFSEQGALIGLSEGSVDLKIVNEASSELIALDPSLSNKRGRLLVIDHFGKILVDSFGGRALLSRFEAIDHIEAPLRRSGRLERAQNEVFFDHTLWLMSENQLQTEGGLEWRVILLRDEAHLKSTARENALSAMIPSIFVTLLILLLGLRLTRRLSEDVSALGEALNEIESGGEFTSILAGYPSLQVKEWAGLFDHAYRFGATLQESRVAIESALEAEQRLNEQQRSLLMALEFIQAGIEITDRSGLILYQNSQAQRLSLLKRPSPELSAYWYNLSEFPPVHHAEDKEESLKQGLTWRETLKGMLEDEERICEITLSPQLHKGELARVIVILRDMTDEYKRREALQVSERLASIGSLASGIAHEVNNPLMYILANVDFALEDLEREALSDEDRLQVISSLEQAKVGAEQVRDVSRSLLSIARKEGEAEWHPLAESIERCLTLVRTEVKHQSELEIDIKAQGDFYGSPSELSQVLMNLIHNALHAMQASKHKRKPKLKIRVSERAQPLDEMQRERRAIIEVIDNGPGISDELAMRIFDPFFTTKARGVGTGLGLSICQRIIHEMSGELSFQSKPDEGTCFEISLPISRKRRVDRATELSDTPEDSKSVDQDQPKILIVDDVVAITEMLCRQLKSTFIVEGVNSGEEAMKRLQEREFDLILSDVMMPNMSGVELYLEISERRPEFADRFLFMTGGVLDEADQRFFERDEVVCLAKPVSRKVLISAIRDQIDKTKVLN